MYDIVNVSYIAYCNVSYRFFQCQIQSLLVTYKYSMSYIDYFNVSYGLCSIQHKISMYNLIFLMSDTIIVSYIHTTNN